VVATPKSYLIPQSWREVIERLQWNGVALDRLASDQSVHGLALYIDEVLSRAEPYEGHLFHDQVRLSSHPVTVQARAGDVLVRLDQANARYAVETLEPQAHDSFFRWGFFNSILEKKEAFSDYVFEDTALELLQAEPALREALEDWKLHNSEKVTDQQALLGFIYTAGKRYAEPEWRRYPVIGLL